MKKIIKLAVIVTLALGSTSAFATNGATMIGVGAKAFGMGGTGIGVSHGAESALTNPAMISTIDRNEVSFGGTLFLPDVENTLNGNTQESKSDLFVIPSVSLASKVNDNFYWGVGMWGTGGLGVDYRESTAQMKMVTALQLMQFGVPLVYKSNSFAIGITPIVQYGSLDVNYDNASLAGTGTADDLAIGYNLGLSYEFNGITIGAVYKSEIEMDYDGVLSTTMSPFVGAGNYDNDTLSSPSEYGIGISYTMNEHTIAIDYKNINWEDAEGYKDFEWQDQDVIAVGYEYATDVWALRCGYQYAESAVKEQDYSAGANLVGIQYGYINMLNLLGFPGTAQSHVTFGGSYKLNDKLSLDLAYVATLEEDDTFATSPATSVSTKHSEDGISFQFNYNF